MGSEGNEAFLNSQLEILTKLKKEKIVIITDASSVCSSKIRQFLSEEYVVYLQASTAIQLERTSRNPEQLLPVSDLKKFLDVLHNDRDDLYEQVSSLTINSDDSALEEHVLKVVNTVSSLEVKQRTDKITLTKKDLIIFHQQLHTPVQLTRQQAKCLKLLSQGKSSKEIANDLNISYRTVEGVIAKLMQILGCASSKELITLYLDQL